MISIIRTGRLRLLGFEIEIHSTLSLNIPGRLIETFWGKFRKGRFIVKDA